MEQTKFERDNRKILVGMLVGMLVLPIVMWIGYDLKNAPLVSQLAEIAIGAVFASMAGAFITLSLIEHGVIAATFSKIKVTTMIRNMILTGLFFIVVGVLFDWLMNLNSFNLMKEIFSWEIIGEFISGMFFALLF